MRPRLALWTVLLAAPALAADDPLLLGMPRPATADPANDSDFLMKKAGYSVSYNNQIKIPNWVAWHLAKADIGSEHRGAFVPDDSLPADWYHVKPSDYSGTGFDRGHMCPSKDRSATRPANDEVFLMTNILPQSPANNQKGWEKLEDYCRQLAAEGSELYIVSGGAGAGGTGKDGFRTTLNASRRIRVPSVTWKVVVVLPDQGGDDLARINASTRVIAVIMPNDMTVVDDWRQYRRSVGEVEELTGYSFFSKLPADVQEKLKVKIDHDQEASLDGTPAEEGDGEEGDGQD